MELRDVINQMISQHLKSAQLADIEIGTVTSVSPLEITVDSAMPPLQSSVLYLTSAVIERKILGSSPCIENGSPLPVEGNYIVINRALETGDIVVLLRVRSGQEYIVLSRAFGGA